MTVPLLVWPDFSCETCGVSWSSYSTQGQTCWMCGEPGTRGQIPNTDGKPFVWQGEIVPLRWDEADLDRNLENV